jgi:NitT/TauT family transport system permease protein
VKTGFKAKAWEKLKTPAVIFLLLVVWELAVRVFKIKEYILPSPIVSLEHLFFPQADANYNWAIHIRATLFEIALAFAVTSVVGILIAIVLAWSSVLKRIVMPIFVFLNSIPIIAIAPLLVLWFGYGLKTNILIAFLVAFFPVVINATVGLSQIDEDLLDLVKYLDGTKLQIFIKLRIPNSLPYIFTGLKISSTMCVVGAIVGEFLASDRGLGYIIINSQYTMDSPPIFAGLMLVSLFGVILFGIVAMLEKLFMPWQFRPKGED